MTGARREDVVASALGRAFLGGDWEPEAMARRGQRVLGDRRRWLFHLARAARSGYPDPPADRPRELATFLAACPVLTERFAADRAAARPLPTVRQWPAAPTRMVARPFPVAVLDAVGDAGDLFGLDPGHLAWFADARGWERTVPDEALRHYRYRWSPKGRPAFPGDARLIEAPKTLLKHVQRRLLREILDAIAPHPAAEGFRSGRSALTHAARHAGQAAVVRFDLEAFFPSVPAGRVFGVFKMAGYPEPVAYTLTALTTNVVPRAVWRAGPSPTDRSSGGVDRAGAAHHRLGRRLATPHLPQGAPTSPALANLVAFNLDRRLTGLAEAVGARYSRYADDLTFSGSAGLWRRAPDLGRTVATIVADEGFRLNDAKTSRRAAGERQVVTGLVVNARPNVRRDEYDALRATLHNAVRTSGPAQNRAAHPDFRAHLAGRVAWVAQVDPERGARLRADLDRVAW